MYANTHDTISSTWCTPSLDSSTVTLKHAKSLLSRYIPLDSPLAHRRCFRADRMDPPLS